jgi:hypothetical protein
MNIDDILDLNAEEAFLGPSKAEKDKKTGIITRRRQVRQILEDEDGAANAFAEILGASDVPEVSR